MTRSTESIIRITAIIVTLASITINVLQWRSKNTFREEVLKSPWLIELEIDYLPLDKPEIVSAWDSIYNNMSPICVKDRGVLVEVPNIISTRAHGSFYLKKNSSGDASVYTLSGRGYYEEAIPNPTGGSIPLVWAFDVMSLETMSDEEMSVGKDVRIRFVQKGQQTELPFDCKLRFMNDRLVSDSTIVSFKGVDIASIHLRSDDAFRAK